MNRRPLRAVVRAMSIAGAVALAVVGVGVAPAVAAPPPVTAGSVQVLDGNGDPIVGAGISLSVGAFGVEHRAVTLADGRVDLTTIPGVDPAGGPYVMWIWANGYAGYWDGATDPDATVPVQVQAGADPLVATVAATNPPPSSTTAGISGTVTDALTGEPIVGIQVTATDDGTGGDNSGAGQTVLDGTYYVNFGGGSLPSTAEVAFTSLATSEAAPFGYEEQFYNGINASASEAETPVDVTAGATVSGINGQLLPNGQLTGTVTDASAGGIVPLGDAQVSVWNRAKQVMIASGSTNPDGSYAFAVPQGSWVVQFDKIVDGNVVSTQYYDGATTFEAAADVEVVAKLSTDGTDAQFGTVPLTPVTPVTPVTPTLPATGPEDTAPLLWVALATILGGTVLVAATAFIRRRRPARSGS
ncbi:hypothetical protein [Microbacterium pygmaeum]|uniref:Uncharacterized protein n=1 Tax=Microbacterium pygmaeum TaxID=370764 RepID=A0A1G7YHT5_9MICO|nr:hypothetical protein [Microbacterium pygmaeum]SDG95779.1 hypothetical protein SAMN04489810_1754 [Microbacterium pygmaeum]